MQQNATYTVTAGSPINLATGTTRAPAKGEEVWAWQVSIQMQHGGSGLGYVMDGIPIGRATAPAASNSADLSLELASATANAPGGSMNKTMPQGQDRAEIAIHEIWIDGSHTGDGMIVSYDKRH